MNKVFDVIIIGGGLTGLTAAYTCQQFGFCSVILEKSSTLGGGSQSFKDGQENIFDSGYHTLDYGRSALTTRLFGKMLEGNFHKLSLKRGIVIKDHLLKYNSEICTWPQDLQQLFVSKKFDDNIEKLSSIKQLTDIYGSGFISLLVEDILRSYPSKKWALDHGGKIEDHIEFVYPWFLPKSLKKAQRQTESEIFHDKARDSNHYVLYPNEGGFAQFPMSFASKLSRDGQSVELNCSDIRFIYSAPGTHIISQVEAKGVSYTAPLIMWCAPLGQLFRMFSLPLSLNGKPQRLILGNFVFKQEIQSDYHEILVGSSKHLINRISFPGKIALQTDNLLQTEFYYPDGEYHFNEEQWKDEWLKSLKEIGIIGNHDLVNFSFRQEIRGFAIKDSFEKISHELKDQISKVQTNLIIPFPMVGPENINRLIPETIQNVVSSFNKKGILL
jgi:protoporphyrinogen oxidase